jgi:4-methyl-5(b-hydroxyethyl)-thiazole monophosphate biosynthesis
MPTALIFIAHGSEEIESITPGDVLVRAGVDVTYAGVGGTSLRGSRGLPLAADIPAEELADDLFDAVVLPGGGTGAENLGASEHVARVVRAHWEAGRIVAAICAAPALVLAPLGLLEARRATCYPSFEDRLGKGVSHAGGPVVEDGKLITSRGPGTAIDFALTLARRLAGEEKADQVREAMLVRV